MQPMKDLAYTQVGSYFFAGGGGGGVSGWIFKILVFPSSSQVPNVLPKGVPKKHLTLSHILCSSSAILTYVGDPKVSHSIFT
jgi:hypothetical protein